MWRTRRKKQEQDDMGSSLRDLGRNCRAWPYGCARGIRRHRRPAAPVLRRTGQLHRLQRRHHLHQSGDRPLRLGLLFVAQEPVGYAGYHPDGPQQRAGDRAADADRHAQRQSAEPLPQSSSQRRRRCRQGRGAGRDQGRRAMERLRLETLQSEASGPTPGRSRRPAIEAKATDPFRGPFLSR